MKFNFCGNLTIPEWLQAQQPQLSQLSALKLRKLCSLLLNHHLTEGQDRSYKSNIHELLKNLDFDDKDSLSIIGVLSFIQINSVKTCIPEDILGRELLDLGIPKENCSSIVKIYKDFKPQLTSLFDGKLPMENQVDNFKYVENEVLLSSGNQCNGLKYYDLKFEKFVSTDLVTLGDQDLDKNDEEEVRFKERLNGGKKDVLSVRVNEFVMQDFKREMNKINLILQKLD